MPELGIQRRESHIPWWVWLIGLIILALIIWWVIAAARKDHGVAGNEVATPGTATMPATGTVTTNETPGTNVAPATATGPITDLSTIMNTNDRSALIGRQFQLSGVNIQSVVGDRGFWVGPNAGQRLFARVDEQLNRGSREWDVDINPGQQRMLRGDIQALPEQDQIRNWGLVSPADMQAINDRGIYLHVTQLGDTLHPLPSPSQ